MERMANAASSEDRLSHALARLVELTATLRGPEGCPWDRAQDYDSLKGLLLEEAYEVVDAVNAREFDGLEDELGDLLFQVVFYSRLAEEEGRFALAGVMERLHQKLVRRHPHVFGEVKARTAVEALRSWNSVKEQEREAKPEPVQSILEGTASALPATLEAHELGVRVAEAGFDWPSAVAVLDKVQEEVDELRRELEAASDAPVDETARARREEELGDLLFSLSQLARHLKTDPESCLRRGNQKFRRRFQALEREIARRGRKLTDCSLAELETVWGSVKTAEKHGSAGQSPANSGASG
jgi:nucleoside triphosphate diphosphatase